MANQEDYDKKNKQEQVKNYSEKLAQQYMAEHDRDGTRELAEEKAKESTEREVKAFEDSREKPAAKLDDQSDTKEKQSMYDQSINANDRHSVSSEQTNTSANAQEKPSALSGEQMQEQHHQEEKQNTSAQEKGATEEAGAELMQKLAQEHQEKSDAGTLGQDDQSAKAPESGQELSEEAGAELMQKLAQEHQEKSDAGTLGRGDQEEATEVQVDTESKKQEEALVM